MQGKYGKGPHAGQTIDRIFHSCYTSKKYLLKHQQDNYSFLDSLLRP